MSHIARTSRLHQLAASLSAALALCGVDTSAHAAIRLVGTCADSGSGSLRQVVSVAASGDTVDLSGLTCSTITLTSGEIVLPQFDITLQGPTNRTVTITSNSASRILHHTGAAGGALTVQYLTVSNGKYYNANGNAKGGCILSSNASLSLFRSTVTGCRAAVGPATGFNSAYGGAIYSAIGVDMIHSAVTGSQTIANGVNTSAEGGGIFAKNGFHASYSTVSGNRAYDSGTGATITAGGIEAYGIFSLLNSTVDSNQGGLDGGISQVSQAATDTIDIRNSTISGNTAANGFIGAGGLEVGRGPSLTIYNSTIAFNSGQGNGGLLADTNVVAQSSIIANNAKTSSIGGGAADLYIIPGFGYTLSGSNNLIVSSSPALAGTLTSDPRLVPLGNHGGPTRAHALSSNSPAIDLGNNVGAAATDQRGTGFARVVGIAADIGAYERQGNDDEIFYDGFNN